MVAEHIHKLKLKNSLIQKVIIEVVYDRPKKLIGFLVYGDSHPFKVLLVNPPLAFLPDKSRYKRYPHLVPPVEGATFSLRVEGDRNENIKNFGHLFRVICAWLGTPEELIEQELLPAVNALERQVVYSS